MSREDLAAFGLVLLGLCLLVAVIWLLVMVREWIVVAFGLWLISRVWEWLR